MAAARGPPMAPAGRVDAHLHVWAPAEEAERFPFAGSLAGSDAKNEPPLPGHAGLLLAEMEAAGVDRAVIVQPGNHAFDHRYVSSVLQAHPDRFIGMLLADPDPSGAGVAQLEALCREEGYRGVRFNPYLAGWGEAGMSGEVGRALYRKAGELGVPVGHMCFKGLMLHLADIEALLADSPATVCILDHFGFCKAATPDSEEWRALLGLARHPQVYVKASAFFRVSAEAHPYADAQRCVRALVDAFGAERVMFGSDWPVSRAVGEGRAAAGSETDPARKSG